MARTKWWIVTAVAAAFVAALALGACSPNSSEPEEQDDTALWASIIWTNGFAQSQPDSKVVMKLSVNGISPGSSCLTENKFDPRFREAFVSYAYDTLPWRAGDPKAGNDGVLQNFFIWDEQAKAFKGGVFEWWEPGIGLNCGMINAMDRDNGKQFMHRAPCSGDKVAFAWTNFAGNQRSNLVQTVWP